MEESKVKTLKDINIYAYQYASDNWSEEYRKISAHSYAAGYVKAQSHITKLEARVKELEEALEKIYNEGNGDVYDVDADPNRYIYNVDQIAEQALNKK